MSLIRRLARIAAVFLGVLAVCPYGQLRADLARDIGDNRSLDQRFINAYLSEDVPGVMNAYDDTQSLTVVFPDGTQVKGWNNVKTGYSSFFSQFSRIRGEITESDYVPTPDGMMGFGKGYFYMTEKSGGPEQRLDFRYTNFRHKQGGLWVYSVDTMQAVAFQPLPTDTLYERIGGYDVIAAVVDDFMLRSAADANLKDVFGSLSDREKKSLRQKLVDMIASGAGGPVVYERKEGAGKHGIDDFAWKSLTTTFSATLDAFHVPATEHTELNQLFAGLKTTGQELYPKRSAPHSESTRLRWIWNPR